MLDITVRSAGPLFDGRARRAAQDMATDCVTVVSLEAVDRLVSSMEGTFRDPTPIYWTRVWSDRVTDLRAEVNDAKAGRRMIYGPWLEGVSPRNRSSRFKGHWIWRTTRQWLARDVSALVAATVQKHLDRMRG